MKSALFSEDWAHAWRDSLNSSSEYRESASSWRWPLVVVAEDAAAWYLDLFEGQCRSIRLASDEDRRGADYVIAGPLTAWEALLQGSAAPIVAIMQGKLKLERGSVVKLSRYSAAAKSMLDAAVAVSAQPARAPSGEPAHEEGETRNVPRGRHTSFRTTSAGGLDRSSFPMQLYHKAKKLGVWDPADIDFAQDRIDWHGLQPDERDVLLRLIAMFQAGEEAVTLDLLPLIRAIASEGRIEEEMYLATFLFEEAKHTEFFRTFLDEVANTSTALDHYHTSSYRKLFYEELPAALNALDRDPSPRAQLTASATYNMVVEGTLAETGYHALYRILDERDILPGLREGTGLLQRDESRHIAYGVYLITRLLEEDSSLSSALQNRMNDLLPLAQNVITELFVQYDPMPFGLREEDFLNFAMDQFAKRMKRIESGHQGFGGGAT